MGLYIADVEFYRNLKNQLFFWNKKSLSFQNRPILPKYEIFANFMVISAVKEKPTIIF